MSGGRERPAAAALAEGWRWLVALGLTGLVLGFAWGIADQPRYEATASVVVEQTFGGEVDEAALERLAALGASEEVATAAAGVLGGDVAGADLLSEVAVEPSAAGGALEITATSELPDFAAATANAFGEALVEVAAVRANAGYRRATERLEEKLAELDPESPEAAAVGERIADLETARASDPLTLGAAATLPDGPSENRPAALTAAIGLLIGALVGLLVLLWRGRERTPREQKPVPGELEDEGRREGPEPEEGEEPAPAEDDLTEPDPGPVLAPTLAAIARPEDAVASVRPGLVALDSAAAEAYEVLADAIGLGEPEGPRTLAVLGSASSGSSAVATGIAVVAADLGVRTLVVDADLGSPSLATLLDVEPDPGLRDYLAGRATPREVLRTLRAEIEGGTPLQLVAVAAGEAGAEAGEGIPGPRFEGLVERLPRVYDVILFAGPRLPDAGGDARTLTELTDGTIVVVEEAAVAVDGLKLALGTLDRERVVGVVTTGPPVERRT